MNKLSRTSTRVFVAAAGLAIGALTLSLYQARQQRDFSAPTNMLMGRVLRKGALLGRTRRIQGEYFCWVSYEFTPIGGYPERNWRLWSPGCGAVPGQAIPVQYVIARPELNRPATYGFPFPPLFLWFGVGVLCTVGFLVHRSENDADVDLSIKL